MVKDKYGYETPIKKAMEFKQGSGPSFDRFRTFMESIIDQVEDFYKEDEMTLNRFNLLFSAASEMMGRIIVKSIERHERGEFPAYGKMISYSTEIRKKMDQLEKLFHLQELTMASYLANCPMLLQEENEHIIEEMRKIGKSQEAAMADMIFKEAFREALDREFGQRGNRDHRDNYGF